MIDRNVSLLMPEPDHSALDGPVILDGFSCQLQAGELTKLATTSTAELLAALLRTKECGERQSEDAEET